MDKVEIKNKMHEIYRKVYTQDINDDINLFLQSGDSVLHMSFATAIQDEFDVQFSMDEYEENTSINKLSALIMERRTCTR